MIVPEAKEVKVKVENEKGEVRIFDAIIEGDSIRIFTPLEDTSVHWRFKGFVEE